ncbi:hypothetical protein GA752_04745 [Bifidobacterium adolescentis]|uniref:Uncharacterized protein n=1 Tax=Bifidobacterium adolescentis TaxID=1680 RepID=A0A7J5MZ54_BIFAD|nr:hypothetical protein GA749_07825 [Bifidobacterium adolescentis]KAB5744762.1 hypothetical protein GA759_02285 [Bifidobacterium adolescentis]KAB5747298.1 hypothetical protein GA752_04745 [Bifidobacterium adolescentis]KAB5749211.1 hypothetical protein GA831_04720 [Bifidobacterium adolescentis]KAB5764751.1 hypothetical protein GA730_07205 [Bifidobacterium adolescentis]
MDWMLGFLAFPHGIMHASERRISYALRSENGRNSEHGTFSATIGRIMARVVPARAAQVEERPTATAAISNSRCAASTKARIHHGRAIL